MTEETTSPDHEPPPPPSGRHEETLLRRILGELLAPLETRLEAIQASLGVTNGQSRSLSGRVTDLEGRVDSLELATSDTEPPHDH
jgi:hypothetical protein